MNQTPRAGEGKGRLPRLVTLVALSAVAALVLLGLYLWIDLIRFSPWWIRERLIEWSAVALAGGYPLARTIARCRFGRGRLVGQVAETLDRVDSVSRMLLVRWLLLVFAGLATLELLTWLPHYPFWPWCRDVDTYALMAQEWDAGVLPYRDIRAFNFPGHIYLHWILGKLFGWGHTGIFYAFDAAALLVLGAVVIAWSRRCLGLALPGLTAYFIFLAYYLSISFESVAERDWHSPLCASIGVLLLEGWPGRRSRWLSAILAAIAFATRPNVVLLFPALVIATAGGDAATRGAVHQAGARLMPSRMIFLALEWTCVLSACVAVGFAPLVFSGLLDDFIRGLAVLRRGGPYSDATSARSVMILLGQLRQPSTAALGIALLLLAVRSPDRDLKQIAHTWLLALAGALFYRPIHPLDHAYLRTPLALVSAIAWAIPIAWLVRAATGARRIGFTPFHGVIGVLLIVYESIPTVIPQNCSLRVSIDSVRAAAIGGWPEVPPGAWLWYGGSKSHYHWDAYCRLLEYVRAHTGPATIVANVLKDPPLPAVNGAIGRRSPFRVESGVGWMWMVAEDLDEPFARDLDRLGDDSIVVWSTEEIDNQSRLALRRLTQVIMDRYAPEARFGRFEVWRRKTSPYLPGIGTHTDRNRQLLTLTDIASKV